MRTFTERGVNSSSMNLMNSSRQFGEGEGMQNPRTGNVLFAGGPAAFSWSAATSKINNENLFMIQIPSRPPGAAICNRETGVGQRAGLYVKIRAVHQGYNRRNATKVKNGKVQRKNNHVPTGGLGYVLDRESPGRGFRHVVSKRDLQVFVDLISDWDKLSVRLERILLCTPGDGYDGMYAFHHREETGTIFLCAWPEDLWGEIAHCYFDAHEEIFTILGISFDRGKRGVFCRFTAAQARAFTLLHVFLHELGHHCDRTHQKHRDASRGEDYAERFASTRFRQLYPEYIRV